MSNAPSRIFLSRLIGQAVFDPAGDQVGKLRDVVVVFHPDRHQARVLGMVVEIPGRRRIFLPITRVTSLDTGQIITTGVLNVRRFEERSSETLVLHELFDRKVGLPDDITGTIFDVAVEQDSRRDWHISHYAVHEGAKRFGRRGQNHVVEWHEVTGLTGEEAQQGATHLLAALDQMRPADLANALRELTPKRRMEVAVELGVERLADVLEELPDQAQVEILGVLDPERAADVLEEMDDDDAADLLGGLPHDTREQLLALMEPDDAEDVRRLLTYDDNTAGGLMTTEPVILPPNATLAEALARIREPELSPALASMVYVCRPPAETPTGRFLGVVHVQALLREPPSTQVGAIVVSDLEWPRPDSSLAHVAKLLAQYDLVACAVVDENAHLLGAITIDDVLDHLLPDDWRESDEEVDGDGA